MAEAITQTAPTGFAEGQAQFEPIKKPEASPPEPEVMRTAQATASPIENDDLRAALERLGRSVLSKPKH